ncbi:hypothetical protein QYE76_060943 [Lolium multiflorum]|uniref:Uncharacterized protein n=1 Tax=Lolium multiflorum TaxID=4521 RepID=A0AAD8S1D5_LOLMU|nr:hypothetical protein QYE76_060943 [Lolium multiflorum]
MVAQAGMDAVYRSDILNKPITPEDIEALEAKRVELLATAKKFKNTAAAMLEERKHAAVFVEDFIQREQEVDEGLAKVKELRKHWEDKIVEAHQEVEKVRREMIAPRKITFATPTEQQPLATPKDNMTKAAKILKKSDEEIDINYLRTLVASAVKQQSKADTSRKLESNPEHCISTAQKDAHDNRYRDDESRTGSSEQRRKTREHPNPIPVPSKTPPSDPRKGKDAMYSGRDKYRNPSPPPNGYPRPPRRRSPAGNTRPQRHGGIVIRDNVLPSRNRNRERTPEPRRNQNNDHEPEPRRSRNEERDRSPAAGRNDQGSQRHGEGSHRSRSQHREAGGRIWRKSDRPPRRNECENVDHTTAMYAFIGGLQRGGLLRHKLTCLANANKLTLDEMISIASDHTAADDDAGGDIAATAIPLHQQKKNRDNGNNSGHKRKNPMTRRVADPTWSPWRSNAGFRRRKRTRPWRRSRQGIQASRKHRPRGKGGKGKNKDKEDSSEAMDEDDNSPDPKAGSAGKSNPFEKKSVGAYHTFLGTPTVRATKEDHPAIVPKEYYALVVSPRIDGYDFSKCLMDGGASLNIMYLETLERMNLTKEQLKHSNTEFHGVVPGKKANSLGSITLPVAFGDVHNFREEKITFEVVPFKSSYHVIFGRPTYHKFHARACYIYTKLKIPGPNGATYQRTMQRCLKDQIGRNVHAYVDDIAVMTRKGSDLISDLTETFENLRRFVSRLGEKALPLYKLLKKTDKFVWDDGADGSSRVEGNTYLPTYLGSPSRSEPMLLYLAATNKVISLVIVVERKEEGHEYDVQRPVYYISEVLTESKQRLDKAPDASLEPNQTWVMHFDGSKQHQGSGAGVTLKSPTGEELYMLRIHFEATNNMAEYEALLHAGTWNARNSVMAAYRDEVDEIAKCFLGYEVKYVRRDDNTAADMLSKLGSGRKQIPPGIFLEHLRIPSLRR